MAMAMVMARSKVLRGSSASAGSEVFRNPTRMVWLSAALLILLAPPVWAQYGRAGPGIVGSGGARGGWQIVPSLLVDGTFTDNVSLAAAGLERSDFVTRLSPGISIVGSGARLRLSARFFAEARYEGRTGELTMNPQLSANGNAELIQQLLFLDASASILQQNISLLGPQADSNINDTGNRTDLRSFFVSPYLRRAFGSTAEGEARLRYSKVSSDVSSAILSNSDSTGITLRLTNGPSFKLYTWNIVYRKDTINYTERQDTTSERVSATGTRLITPLLRIISTVGYEKNDYQSIGDEPTNGMFWSAGVEWTPTPRTKLTATTGRRFFGTTHFLDFSHRTRLTVWRASYSEDITTTREEFLIPTNVDTAGFLDTLFLSSFPDPAARQLEVQNFISQNGLPASLTVPLNFLTNQIFLEKRFLVSFGILGIRHSVLANVFRNSRTPQDASVPLAAAGDFATTSRTEQTGGSVNWNWRWSQYTSANANVSYSLNEFSDLGREDHVTIFRVSLNRQFQPRLSGRLSYRWYKSDSDQNFSTATENAITASIRLRF